jgi:hypothetical protein
VISVNAQQPLVTADLVPDLGMLHIPLPSSPFDSAESEDPDRHAVLASRSWPTSPDERARYRWWIGHQVTFCVWRLLAESLTAIAANEHPAPEPVANAARLYDAYSALLCYAGSCTPEVYSRAIRAEMVRADPAFTGRWSRDYERIPALLRSVRRTRSAADISQLVTASRANQMAHIATAKRLVPNGISLLQQSTRAHDDQVTDRDRDLLDAFFLVTRAQISRAAFTAQLSGLTALVLADLADRPLEDDGGDTITRFQRDAVAILRSLPERYPPPACGRTSP